VRLRWLVLRWLVLRWLVLRWLVLRWPVLRWPPLPVPPLPPVRLLEWAPEQSLERVPLWLEPLSPVLRGP
jgi:hypothetical protein